MSALRKAFCNSVIIWNAPQEFCQLLLAGHIIQYLGYFTKKKVKFHLKKKKKCIVLFLYFCSH